MMHIVGSANNSFAGLRGTEGRCGAESEASEQGRLRGKLGQGRGQGMELGMGQVRVEGRLLGLVQVVDMPLGQVQVEGKLQGQGLGLGQEC